MAVAVVARLDRARPAEGNLERRMAAALGHQTAGPVPVVATVEEALRSAAEMRDRWIWLLERAVVPEPDALAALLDAAAGFDPPPALLSSRVLAPDGSLSSRSEPVADAHRPERIVAALGRGCVAIRVARAGSLLVQAPELQRLGLTETSVIVDRELEWTARLLRDRTGLLVPRSVAVALPPGRDESLRRLPVRFASGVRMIAALEPRDRPWYAVHLASRARPGRRGQPR